MAAWHKLAFWMTVTGMIVTGGPAAVSRAR